MVITPNSDIILLKSPLKLDHENQITFSNATDQYNYFNSLPKLSINGATYQRKDGVIRFPTHTKIGDGLPTYEDILKYNYCMYKNTNYSNKRFYAYIVDITYQNDGMTEVKIETDVFQTWQFDIVYMNSFIEREHVSDDTVGLHTIPEGLETGDYIINDSNNLSNRMASCYICVAVTWVPDNTPVLDYEGRIYNKIFSGNLLLLFRNADDCTRFIKCYDKMARAEAITNIYMVPILATDISPDDGPQWKTYTYGSGSSAISTEFAILPYSLGDAQIEQDLTVSNISSLNGYVPKNNKLKVFPYSYLSITNNNGTEVTFKYEDFINNLPTFDINCNVTAGSPSMLVPTNYKLYGGISGHDIFYNFGLAGGKFPTCSWNTDPYINWLTENGVNILGLHIDAPTTKALGGTIEAFLGAVNLGSGDNLEGISQAGSGIGKMFGAIQEQWRHSLQSPTLNGQIASGDLSYSHGNTLFTYYKMSIRYEYAKIIDDFFSMYGYKVNKLATPNIHKRSNWDFIKCSNVNLEGEIPEGDLDKIRRLFNNGCTFWHTTQYYLDYSRTNSIL